MSQVFRAVDIHLQREVALKVLHQSLSRDSALTAMFEREAKLTASILHPNVVKVYTVGKDEEYFFIAMELVHATSLEDLIATKGALPEKEVLHIAHDVTSGLLAAYEEGLIHRDIKPGNMLVTDDGTAKLVDFGLAVQQGGEDESEELWATPFYVPPEKLEGEMDTYLGDIYSLGATLFHALAGHPPFEANTSSLDELKVIKQQEVDLRNHAPNLSKATLKLIETMMAYRAEDRPQTYGEILSQIEAIEKREFGKRRNTREGRGKRNSPWVLGGSVVGLLAVGGALYLAFRGGEDSGTGDLPIISGERVISVGENTITGKFLQGRDLIGAGNFDAARPIFDELARETTLSPSTRVWTLFFQGLVLLHAGDDDEARDSFAMISAIKQESEEGTEEVFEMMGKTSLLLSSPLPVRDPDKSFASESIELAALFAAGLKNWQHGQFESAASVFGLVREAAPRSESPWISGLAEAASPFLGDLERISSLPNPSRRNGEDLAAMESRLEEALDALETKGAAPRLVRKRLDRIAAIREMEEKEKAAAKPPKTPVTVVTVVEPKKMEPAEPPGSTTPGSLTPEERVEKARLLELLASVRGFSDTLLFSGASAKIKAEEFSTGRGKKWKEDILIGYDRAGGFLEMLALQLADGAYEGTIRRREGVPIEAKITSADPATFVIDLGFGPNDVGVEIFAPDWLVEAAVELLPEPAEATTAEWERVVFFALTTGQREAAERHAAQLSEVSPEFAERWQSLEDLRSVEE